MRRAEPLLQQPGLQRPEERQPEPQPPQLSPRGTAFGGRAAHPGDPGQQQAARLAGGTAAPATGEPKRGVFFDFDSTITTPIKIQRFHRHAIADRVDIFSAMTGEEIVANFGGRQRLQRLVELFGVLREAGCELFIVSIGFRDSIIPHLKAVGLIKFFSLENIYGQDSPGMQTFNCAKGRLIATIMSERGWGPEDALFIDDSAKHIDAAVGVCDLLHVAGRGLSNAELDWIRAVACAGDAAALVASATSTGSGSVAEPPSSASSGVAAASVPSWPQLLGEAHGELAGRATPRAVHSARWIPVGSPAGNAAGDPASSRGPA